MVNMEQNRTRVNQQIVLMLQTQLRLWDDMRRFEQLMDKDFSNLSEKIKEYAADYDGFLPDDVVTQFLSELEAE